MMPVSLESGPFASSDSEVRAVIDMSSIIESSVAKGDTESATRVLEGLLGLLCNRFRNQERGMTGFAGHDDVAHRREHEALLSGLSALRGAIMAADLARVRALISTFVNRMIRHVVDHDLPFTERQAAA